MDAAVDVSRSGHALEHLQSARPLFRATFLAVMIGLAAALWAASLLPSLSNPIPTEHVYSVFGVVEMLSFTSNGALYLWIAVIGLWPTVLARQAARALTIAVTSLGTVTTLLYLLYTVWFAYQVYTASMAQADYLVEQVASESLKVGASIFLCSAVAGVGVAMMRAPREALASLRERGSIYTYLGAPAAVRELGRIQPKAVFLFTAAAFCNALLLLSLIGIAIGSLEGMLNLAFIQAFGVDFLLAWKWIVPPTLAMFLALLVGVASSLLHRGRAQVRVSAATAMEKDPRPPIVFLRSFRDDQCVLRTQRTVLSPVSMSKPLDHVLVEEFAQYGPLIALGKPGESTPPFGVWRTYFHDATDDRWKEEVISYCSRAQAIVMVADDTPGVAWELELIARPELTTKALLLAAPRFANPESNANLWRYVGLRMAANFFGSVRRSCSKPRAPRERGIADYAISMT